MSGKISRTVPWMVSAFLGSLIIAGTTLWMMGTGQRGTLTGLQLTGRFAFCFFLPAYVGGALVILFGRRFQPLTRNARNLGLAFASALAIHLCLVVWDYHISAQPPVGSTTAIFFIVAALCAYLLALFSIPTLAARLHPRIWWALRTFGMDYIEVTFLRDFLHNPFNGSLAHLIGYLPFIALGLAAGALRIGGYAMKMQLRRLPPQTAEQAQHCALGQKID